ncbi:hypothetical protein FPV67DRAFT_259300 [Lyophyllum atratum]|nr:hypothetical protein FPV67DRAFT_259300 [Lyophyllum atratum]
MRAPRGLCLLVSILATFHETLADSIPSNFHIHKTPIARHDSSQAFAKRQATDFGTLTTAFRSAIWIWTADANPLTFNSPPGDRLFRKTYVPPVGKLAVLAEVLITVDNRFSFFVNGALVGVSPPTNPDSWESAQGYRMALNPGPTVFALRGTNMPDAGTVANPAAVLVAIRITHSDATQVLIMSDGTWRSNILPVANFELPETDDSTWASATALARFGNGPWGIRVALPNALVTVTLPPPATSSVPPTSTLSSTTSSVLPSSTSSIPTTSVPPRTSSTVTVTRTSLDGDATGPAASPGSNTKDKDNRAVLIGAILGGMIGFLILLTIVLVLWRRRKQASDVAAADFKTWEPAPHISHEPFSDQNSYNSEPKYGQPAQAPYRYPPPSAVVSAHSSPAPQPDYQPQYNNNGYGGTGYSGNGYTGNGYNADGYRGSGYGGSAYAGNRYTDTAGGGAQGNPAYGSTAQLVPAPAQNRSNSVPPMLTPGSAAPAYYSSSAVETRPLANPHDNRYYR